MPETVFTIGHSTHTQERFIALLSQHGVTALCDVRSKPYSRVNPQFNREELKKALKTHGISYVFLGKELGARSEDPSCYENGKVQYDRLAKTDLFRQGIQRVQDGMKTFKLALMCAEKEPLECHRTILVARHLSDLGIDVQHIHATGKLESHSDALKRLAVMLKLPQADLFSPNQDMFAAAYRRQEERIAYDANAGAAAVTAPVAESAIG
jgi:uncharacterized protein (DUF488 family)